MKKEIAGLILAGILLVNLGGCMNNSSSLESSAPLSSSSLANESASSTSAQESLPVPEVTTDYAEIYISVFDSYFEQDPALHDGMKYIAIDMDTLEHASEGDKAAISEYFRTKYGVDVMDASFADLEEQNMVGDGNSLEGILLSVESVSVDKYEIIIEGSKFRSGLGANGFESTLTNKDGVWALKETKMTWIA